MRSIVRTFKDELNEKLGRHAETGTHLCGEDNLVYDVLSGRCGQTLGIHDHVIGQSFVNTWCIAGKQRGKGGMRERERE